MTQEIAIAENHILVSLAGSLYAEEAARLHESLFGYVEKENKMLIIDFKDVDYIDCSGMGTLIALQKKARKNGGSIILKGLKGLVKEIFEMTRVIFVFEVQ